MNAAGTILMHFGWVEEFLELVKGLVGSNLYFANNWGRAPSTIFPILGKH